MNKTIIVIRCKLPKSLCKVLSSAKKYICPVPIDSMKTFGIKYMLSLWCILMMSAAAVPLWENMVFDKTRTYSLTHTWFIKIHTQPNLYCCVSLMRRKHEVNIIWIDSTRQHSHITFHVYQELWNLHTFDHKKA